MIVVKMFMNGRTEDIRMNREQLIDKLDQAYNELCREGFDEQAEYILINNNASDDDSDPDEGFMATMSDNDLRKAIKEMEALYSSLFPDTVEAMIHAINGGTLDASPDYCEGFIDACKMIADEYGMSFASLDD